MLHVDFLIIGTGANADSEPVKSCYPAVNVLHLGLIGEAHYVLEVVAGYRHVFGL